MAGSGGGRPCGHTTCARPANAEEPEERGFSSAIPAPSTWKRPSRRLDREFTPNDRFFVRSHLVRSAIGREPWELAVGGQVKRPLTLTTADLAGFAPGSSRPSCSARAMGGRIINREFPEWPGTGARSDRPGGRGCVWPTSSIGGGTSERRGSCSFPRSRWPPFAENAAFPAKPAPGEGRYTPTHSWPR